MGAICCHGNNNFDTTCSKTQRNQLNINLTLNVNSGGIRLIKTDIKSWLNVDLVREMSLMWKTTIYYQSGCGGSNRHSCNYSSAVCTSAQTEEK